MYSPKITSDSLRKKLQDLGLREDNDGYWYYDPFNNDDWMIAAYEDDIRISTKVTVDKNGIGYFEGLGNTLNCVDDEEKILEQVNKLLKQVKRLDLTKKKKKMKIRMNKLKKDFQ
jgi:hypothetical protein